MPEIVYYYLHTGVTGKQCVWFAAFTQKPRANSEVHAEIALHLHPGVIFISSV